MNRPKIFTITLVFILFTQACVFSQPQNVAEDRSQTVEATEAVVEDEPRETSTPLPSPTSVPSVEPSSTLTPAPTVHVVASGGNLYIRRGPEMAYDRIGILSNGTSAEVIGKDVLSKWVQIRIPNSEQTGWVSLLTPFTSVEGDLADVPAFTFTEWPEPAYVKNCTEHAIIIMPIELYLNSLWTNAKYLNQSQIDPGFYEIRDASMEGEPLIETVDIKEGQTYYITINGLGEYHKCPKEN